MTRIGRGMVLGALAPACAPTVEYPDAWLRGTGGRSTGLENVALLLRDPGHVALVVDSFSWPSRRVFTVCDDPSGESPTSLERVEDAFAARRYLASLTFVDSSRIGLVG
jgi:dienelactone hydrolase